MEVAMETPPPTLPANTQKPRMIIPPAEIRNIIDKTAAYVAKTGPHFETRIRENEAGNPKFAFLNPDDPYRPYYDLSIRRQISKLTGEPLLPEDEALLVEAGITDESAGISERADEQSQAKAAEEEKPPETPPPSLFLAPVPPISSLDLSILRLTAQFVALNGRNFLGSLQSRESRNVQFEFLNPNNPLFAYFTKMVEEYSIVLHPPVELLKELKMDEWDLLERCTRQVEYERWVEKQKAKQKEQEDADNLLYASIEWHQFVPVQTLTYDLSDTFTPLPPPISITTIKKLPLTDKKNFVEFGPDGRVIVGKVEVQKEEEEEMDVEMEMEMDESSDEDDETPAKRRRL